jgi:hypothetical protein
MKYHNSTTTTLLAPTHALHVLKICFLVNQKLAGGGDDPPDSFKQK